MPFNARMDPRQAATGTFASVATNGSSNQIIRWVPIGSGAFINVRFVNGTTSSVASGTTAGSAMNVYVYKTAISTTNSVVGSARLAQVATLATQALGLSTSTTFNRFSGGEQYIAEIYGGAGNDRDNAGAYVVIDYMYAHNLPDGSSL